MSPAAKKKNLLVTAIVQPYKKKKIEKRLSEIGVGGITYYEVKGFGRHGNYMIDTLNHTKIEIWVEKDMLDEVLSALKEESKEGETGHGIVFVSAIDQVIQL